MARRPLLDQRSCVDGINWRNSAMTVKFRNNATIALACVAVVEQSGLAAGQQSDRARFQAYQALSIAATAHFVVNKDVYLSYTVEPADDVCTIVLRNAKIRARPHHSR